MQDINFITTLYIPITLSLITILTTALITKFITNKQDKATTQKLEVEIQNLKKNYQPFVFDALNKIGNELLPRKIRLLDNLIKIKSQLFFFENEFLEGNPRVDEYSIYLETMSKNINKEIVTDFQDKVLKESYYFNSNIIDHITRLSSNIKKLKDYDSIQQSILSQDAHPESKQILKEINTLFLKTIELIRQDLQLDNLYIQNFLKHYNTVE